jgi:NADH-ubiquinone oxidoreductase chain 5
MEGPTPVSALIHAATMVTAGVFLLIRCSALFEFAPTTLLIIALLGSLTTFFAATAGMLQHDIKKVIAYSTCSQLGYMVFTCGLSAYNLSLFHLYTHAFFKALLFLTAGAIIHSLKNEQDLRRMGGLLHILPLSYIMMLVGSLALIGFPFLSGFYSKDVILETAFACICIKGTFTFWLGTISALCTVFYSIRLLTLIFFKNTNSFLKVINGAHEMDFIMALPLILLSFSSIFLGYLSKDFFIGMGSQSFNTSIFILPRNFMLIDAEFIPIYIKLIPTFISVGTSILFFNIYKYNFSALITYKKKN